MFNNPFCTRYLVSSTFHYGSIKIASKVAKSLTSISSTFHYGSIKISLGASEKTYCIGSTFHYGSIKIY